jgi:hypothetical protein
LITCSYVDISNLKEKWEKARVFRVANLRKVGNPYASVPSPPTVKKLNRPFRFLAATRISAGILSSVQVT